MSRRTRNRPASTRRELTTPDGLITVPPGSPKILIHTRQGRCVGIYCDQPAKVLVIETQEDPRRAARSANLAMLAMNRSSSAPAQRAALPNREGPITATRLASTAGSCSR